MDFFGSRSDLFQPQSELYASKSDLYSPRSELYGSKGEFVYPKREVYSPKGTLLRGEDSGHFYESDSGVSSLYEPLSFQNHSLDLQNLEHRSLEHHNHALSLEQSCTLADNKTSFNPSQPGSMQSADSRPGSLQSADSRPGSLQGSRSSSLQSQGSRASSCKSEGPSSLVTAAINEGLSFLDLKPEQPVNWGKSSCDVETGDKKADDKKSAAVGDHQPGKQLARLRSAVDKAARNSSLLSPSATSSLSSASARSYSTADLDSCVKLPARHLSFSVCPPDRQRRELPQPPSRFGGVGKEDVPRRRYSAAAHDRRPQADRYSHGATLERYSGGGERYNGGVVDCRRSLVAKSIYDERQIQEEEAEDTDRDSGLGKYTNQMNTVHLN